MAGLNGLPLHADDLRGMNPDAVKKAMAALDPAKLVELRNTWRFWARANQIAPEGDWNNWLILAGRGFGKTRAGVEWCREQVKSGKKRIMAVAATNSDIERVMVKGESGFLSVCWKGDKTHAGKEMGFPEWSPTKRTLTWKNGATVTFFSAEEPERLRGPQGDAAWCFIEGTQVLTPNGNVDVTSLKVGDLVVTRDGPKPILYTSERMMPVGTVKFSNGSLLTGTAEHPIYTNRGWVNLGDLKHGDKVCVTPALSGVASVGTATMTDTTNTVELGAKVEKTATGFIARFMKKCTGQFRKVSKFTTSTVTKETTGLKTSSACQTQNINAFTAIKSLFQSAIGQVRKSLKFVATTAAVLLNAKQKLLVLSANGVSQKGQMTSAEQSDRASVAEKSLYQSSETFAVSVVSTWADAGRQVVYNIQVAEKPEYFANGILTHNCDEMCAWNNDKDTWDMLQFCLRLGKHPKICITTTPKPTKLLRDVVKNEKTIVTRGSTFDNSANLASTYIEAVKQQYEGTRLGRQELYAEVLEEAAGALWSRELLDTCMIDVGDPVEFAKTLSRVIVSVDPAVTANKESDMTGIIVAGVDINGTAYILEDATDRLQPEAWATKAISLYNKYSADRVVAERNQGGDMVRSTLRTVDDTVPLRLVHASRGKFARAEPVSALYERGKVKHVRGLDDLETQMVTWEPLGAIGSPDRLDATVWAVTDLCLKGVIQPTIQISYGDRNQVARKSG